jgi:Acetoacetate decarboxylase (ADC)
MTSPNPFPGITVNGDSIRRGITLAPPNDFVRSLLPPGLELGDQTVTEPGTHPVLLFFNDMFRVQFSIPSLTPNMTYHEYHVGIPFTYLTTGSGISAASGPYYFMPKLCLDAFLPIFGGVVFWGFAKELASITVAPGSYTVTGVTGERAASLTWRTPIVSPYRPLGDFPNFVIVQQMLSQTIVSRLPAAVGPCFVLSNFVVDWDLAGLRPMNTSVEAAGIPVVESPLIRWSPGIDESVRGSYDLRSTWRISLPWSPSLFPQR